MNKKLLVLGAGVIVSVTLAGLYFPVPFPDTQLMDDNSSGPQSGPEQSGTPTPIPTETGQQGGATATQSSETQPTDGELTTISTLQGDTTETPEDQSLSSAEQIERALQTKINEYREANDKPRLQTTGRYTSELTDLATAHSRAMATEGVVQHSIDATTTATRYKQYGLYETCGFASNSGRNLIQPELGRTELIANPVSVAEYENPNVDGYTGNALSAAQSAVDIWSESRTSRRKLLYNNAELMGVGVVVTERQSVYVTVAVCQSATHG